MCTRGLRSPATSVIGALKRGLAPLQGELGIHVCGGRGKHSRQTPHELVAIGDRVGFDGAALTRASRLVAKVDSAAVQADSGAPNGCVTCVSIRVYSLPGSGLSQVRRSRAVVAGWYGSCARPWAGR